MTSNLINFFEREHQLIASKDDGTQSPIMALLKGPDIQYKKLLMNDSKQLTIPIRNNACSNKDPFVQVQVREFKFFQSLINMYFIELKFLTTNNITC